MSGFVSLDRGSQDMAARAGLALAVRRLEKADKFDASTVGNITHNVLDGLWAFPESSSRLWASDAKAVHQHCEGVSNRKWDGYSSRVRAAALEVADHVEEMVSRTWDAALYPTAD